MATSPTAFASVATGEDVGRRRRGYGVGRHGRRALWAMLPAYIPNNAAVLAGGGRPIDGGRTWGGRRVLGDGKTWRGTPPAPPPEQRLRSDSRGHARVSAALGTDLPTFPLRAGLGLAFGAMLEISVRPSSNAGLAASAGRRSPGWTSWISSSERCSVRSWPRRRGSPRRLRSRCWSWSSMHAGAPRRHQRWRLLAGTEKRAVVIHAVTAHPNRPA